MRRTSLKIAIVSAGWKHQSLAERANLSLPVDQRLSEHTITQFVTFRKAPTAQQAAVLAAVLGRSVRTLFPRNGGGHQ